MLDSRQKTSTIRVLVVDDHTMVRQGLRCALEVYPNIEVVGEASNGDQAIECVAKVQPTVVVMDIVMPKILTSSWRICWEHVWGVSIAARTLAKAGLISYTRDSIHVGSGSKRRAVSAMGLLKTNMTGFCPAVDTDPALLPENSHLLFFHVRFKLRGSPQSQSRIARR